MDELVDDRDISGHSADLTYFGGFSFTLTLRIFASLFGFMGLAMLTSDNIAAIVAGIVAFGGALFTTTSAYGTDICFRTNYVREYHRIFGIKTGKWVTTHLMPDICILKISMTRTRSDLTGMASTAMDVSANEVFIMSANHRKRIFVKKCKNLKEAVEVGEFLSEKMNKKLVPFKPKISQQSIDRRR